GVALGISVGSSTAILRSEDAQKFMDLVKMADGYGATAVGTYDSAFLGGDAYVRATLMALASARALVGLRPTNPLTREPQVMASFLASIDSLTHGRAFMDIASGDSAVYNIGYPPASRARIEDYVTCVRELLAKGEATYQGRPQRVRWASTAVRPRIPISICAEGPKMLHLGGRIGDGVVAGTGLLPEVIHDTLARIHAGGGTRPVGRRHLVHRSHVAPRGPRQGHRQRQALGLVHPEPLHAVRSRREERTGSADGEGPGLRGRIRALRACASRGREPPAH